MSASSIKPWNKVVRLREEVRTGELSLQEFAADLFDVVMLTGRRPLYEDPAKFFSLTYATSSLRDIVAATAERLRGKSTKAIRQLELTYGGGKTHTMVTVTHLFRDPAALPDVPSVKEFQSAIGGNMPKARVAAVCFDKLDLEKGILTRAPDGEERHLKQPWSVIAFQLAGADGLRMIHSEGKDEERDTPPRDGGPLEDVLRAPGKDGAASLILFDECLMYVAEKARHPVEGPHFRQQFLNFLQSLTQAVAGVDNAAMIVSLLASDPKKDDEFGRELLNDMANIMGRKEDESFLPVGKDDVAEVLRRRLLDPDTTKDPEVFRANVVAVVNALKGLDPEFAKTVEKRDQRERQYLASFPFDPALMDVFYTKWTSGLPLFQRTRGVLRTFAVALRDAEGWDTSPVAGASVLLNKPGETVLSTALRDLAEVARVEQVEGASQNWIAILQRELEVAQDAQSHNPALTHREIEQAVVGTFLHSQPQGTNHATTPALLTMIGTGKPDRITVEKGLQHWADRSWYLDETHLDSGEKRAEGRGLPKTWRVGNQPNLKQMHDEARTNRVTASAIDDYLQSEIKAAKWLDATAQSAGARVHKLPATPGDVPDDEEFRYVVLGPAAQSESGKPSSLAVRYCEETTTADRPRSHKNSILIAAPSRTGLDVVKDRIRDYLAWGEVKSLVGDIEDPIRTAKLVSNLDGARKAVSEQLRQAYCIVVTRGDDDVVHAFKVNVDVNEPLFSTIKKDPKSRIEETTLAPDLLLPGGPYDLWRDDEDTRRVTNLVGAFSEQAKLPKMLGRGELLKTVANGAEQGLYVLSLRRPDGTFRTWWRSRIDEAACKDNDLEAVQPAKAILTSLAQVLVVPGALEGLGAASETKVADLVGYFAGGKIVSVEHDGWTELRAIPKCDEATVLSAVSEAVEAGLVWLTNGPASVFGAKPDIGVVGKSAVIRTPPDPVAITELTPENLPDAWASDRASALSMLQALSAKRGGVTLPWTVVSKAITSALNHGFVELEAGGVSWPCELHQAGAVEFRVPAATGSSSAAKPKSSAGASAGAGSGAGGGAGAFAGGPKPFRQAVLDTSGVQNLVDALDEIVGAAGSLTVRFQVGIQFEDGEVPDPAVAEALTAALAKVSASFQE